MRDNTTIIARIYSPMTNPPEGSPGLVIWHGGGFCLGDLDSEVALCWRWTAMGGVAVNVAYRLAPEHPFPQAVYDAYDSLLWVRGRYLPFVSLCLHIFFSLSFYFPNFIIIDSNSILTLPTTIQTSTHLTELGINPQLGFIIGGVSAGANLAAVSAHLYQSEKRSPPLTGQYLAIPTICDPSAVPPQCKAAYVSREQNKDALVLNQKSIDMFEGNLSSYPTKHLWT
jgi:acetyl esterase/lipase